MAIIRYHREPGQNLSPEQIEEIEEARKMPITYDEDSPEITPKMAAEFREARKRKPLPKTLMLTYLSEEAEDENLDEERIIQARKAAQTEKSYDDDEVWDILGV